MRDNDFQALGAKFTVVIPTKDRCEDLLKCLHSLDQQKWKLFEILVIDNASTDATAEVARGFGVSLVTDPTDNLTDLFNRGWKTAKTDLVAYLNDDTEVMPGWAETVSTYFSRNPNVQAIGGPTLATHSQRMYQIYEMSRQSIFLDFMFRIYNTIIMGGRFLEVGEFNAWGDSSIGGSLHESTKIREPFRVNGLSITNMAIKREALESIGGFDRSFRYIHADGDLFLRMQRRGLRMIFHPRMVALHYVNPRGNTRSYYNLARDSCILWLKHSRSPKARFLALLHATFMTGYVVLFVRRPTPLFQVRNWFGGLIDGFRYYCANKATMVI